ncbi:MAG: hypothetical protein ACREBW_09535 [Candidatus Micrarchaeaceae archaeon]
MKTPKVLDKMVDIVLRYRPESKVKEPRERKKKPKPEKQVVRDSSK